jgi:hypothetical protein
MNILATDKIIEISRIVDDSYKLMLRRFTIFGTRIYTDLYG